MSPVCTEAISKSEKLRRWFKINVFCLSLKPPRLTLVGTTVVNVLYGFELEGGVVVVVLRVAVVVVVVIVVVVLGVGVVMLGIGVVAGRVTRFPPTLKRSLLGGITEKLRVRW